MSIADSNPAAALTFHAAVHRALARRRADTPLPPRPEPAPPAPLARPAAEAGTPVPDPQ